MKFNLIVFVFLCALAACKEKEKFNSTFFEPTQGQNFNIGDTIKLKLDTDKNSKIDSIVYLVDDHSIVSKKSADSVWIATTNLPLGYRMISAIITTEDGKDTISTNIVLKTNHPPVQLKYKVVHTFPHDTSSYTEGLSYVDASPSGEQEKFLESTGEKGASALKYVDINTGKDLQRVKLAPEFFGEGSLKIDNKIIMLTWQENMGFIFDAKTFKQLGTFPYQSSREGWGLTFDGKNILRTDGTNRIWRMNAKTYREESYLEVYDNKGAVDSLNELEYVDGKIYANVYLSNKIIRINPMSGLVEAEIDLTALVPKNYFKTTEETQNNVLNGIAWDKSKRRLFIVGKKWAKLYQIAILN